MDPSQQLGVPTGFTQVDVKTGLPAVVVNEVANYGWEYVWHCHILGHEENDFMRPVKFNANEVAAAAPTGLALSGTTLSWTDAALTEYQYTVEGSTSSNGNTWVPLGTGLANSTSMTVPTTYTRYRVTAVGATAPNGSAMLTRTSPPAAPTSVQPQQPPGGSPLHSVTLRWQDNATNETGFIVNYRLNTNPVVWTPLPTAVPARAGTGNVSVTFALPAAGQYRFQVVATNAGGSTASTQSSSFTVN
jgi:hypothetical protein